MDIKAQILSKGDILDKHWVRIMNNQFVKSTIYKNYLGVVYPAMDEYAETLVQPLIKENERLKGLIEKHIRADAYICAKISRFTEDKAKENEEDVWQQFKTENNL